MSAAPDVLIVGAGPAGSSLALRLARAGVRTTIVDARPLGRSKPCGDAISPGATPLLGELGVKEAVEARGGARIGGWRLRAPDGRWFSGRFLAAADPPRHGYALPRADLDALLLERAIAAGARFLARRRVFDLIREPAGGREGRVRGVLARGPDGREERHEARLVVGADGLRSRVARRLGGVRGGGRADGGGRLALVGRFEGGGLGAAFGEWGEMRISAEGVLGAAPTGPDRCTLALVVPRRLAAEISADPGRFYRERLRAYGVWSLVSEARPTGPPEITGPFGVSPRRLTAPGALLTGDAAGYYDPFTGQGIYRALRLGQEAATASLEALERPEAEAEALAAYARRARRALVPSRRVQRLIDAFVSRPGLMNPAARLLARRPRLACLLVDVTGDRLPPAALVAPSRLLSALLASDASPPVCSRGSPSSETTLAAMPASSTTRSHHAHA